MLGQFFASVPEHIVASLGGLSMNIPSEHANREINQLLQNSVLSGGKRLRPLLTYLAGDLYGVAQSDLHVLARSIEQVHAASLAHDDVVDGASTRRGRLSINAQSSNKHAVLGGDYLLAHVIVELTKLGNLDLVGEMAQVIHELAEGEWLQLEAALKRNYSRDVISQVADKKTASVMSWCFVAPAIRAQLPSSIVYQSRTLGRHLGQAFQLMDDVLDFSETSQKDPFLDMENGLANAVIYEWLEAHPQEHARYRQGEALKGVWSLEGLPKALSLVESRAQDHLQQARELLAQIQKELAALGRSSSELELKAAPLAMAIDFIGKRTY